MGGRSQVVGLLAVAVVLLLASPIAAPSAIAEVRIPVPGVFQPAPKAVTPKRYFRPTMPRRNPTRVTAGVSASAVSPPQADNSETAVSVGTSSSASVALALDVPAKPPANDAQTETGAETEAPSQSAEATPTEATPTEVSPADEAEAAPEEIDEPAETAEAEDESDPTADEPSTETAETEPAPAESAEATETATATETEDTARDEADKDETPAEVTEADEATTPVEDETPEATDAAESTETDAQGAATPVELAEETEAEAIATDAEPSKVAETEPADAALTVTAAVPVNDASVVLEIAPPPEEVLVAAPAPPADEVSPGDAASSAGGPEAKIAALTPADAPAAAPEPADKAPDSTELDAAPDPAEAEDASATDAENPSADGGVQAEEAAEAEKTAEETAPAEALEPTLPPPPPAHPVVAEIRATLEDPGKFKNVAASDLKALKEFYGAHEGPPLWVTDIGFSEKARAVMAEIRKADDWGLDAASFELPPEDDLLATPNAHADDELELSIAVLSYARDAQIGRLSPSQVSKLFDQHPKLRDPKTVLTETAAAGDPSAYLVSLHPQHPQFKRLQAALARARESAQATGRNPNNDRNVQLIVINMERWRWMPRELGNYYVWNNIPEFNTRVFKGGRPIYQEKTIVGQYQYATPFFTARMRNIVFHPNWTVPPTIIKEDLAPKLKGPGGGGFFGSSKDAMLARYGLAVNYKGQRISADSVDWNTANVHAYTFTQEPGPANVLGQFKFNFPNKHAIYMHDTPQRELFAQTTRTLSHGCIRVNQPDRLAALLLGEDKGWSMAQIRSLIAKGPQDSTVIALNRSVPVHLTYFTAIVEEDGRLNPRADIYGIDNRMAGKLFKNPAQFPVPATPEVAESGSSSRAQAQRRRQSNDFDSFISGLFGN